MKTTTYIALTAICIAALGAVALYDAHAAVVASDYVVVTTDASGDAEAYSGKTYNGSVRLVLYEKSDFANGVDFTITSEDSGQTIWTQNDVNASAVKYPLTQACSTAGVAATLDGTRAFLVPISLVNERIKVVGGSGGDTKSGTFAFAVEGI